MADRKRQTRTRVRLGLDLVFGGSGRTGTIIMAQNTETAFTIEKSFIVLAHS
jgi:hypothetical protein